LTALKKSIIVNAETVAKHQFRNSLWRTVVLLKKIAALLPVVAALVFAGCDHFNVPIKPFIDLNMAKVTLGVVDFGVQADGARWKAYSGDSYEVPVKLNNPQGFNIKAAVSGVSINGTPPPQLSSVTIGGCTKYSVLVRLTGVQRGDRYSIALKITSKDGVEWGERVFDIPLTLIVFDRHWDVKELFLIDTFGTGNPQVVWNMQKDTAHGGIDEVIIDFKYFNTGTQSEIEKKYIYVWDGSAPINKLLGTGGIPPAGFSSADLNAEYWQCFLPFPEEVFVTPRNADTLLGCSFKVTVRDIYGLSAQNTSEGYNENYGRCEARISGAVYNTLAMAITAAEGTENAPTVIQILRDIKVSSQYLFLGNKHIELVSVNPAQPRTLLRQTDFFDPMFVMVPPLGIAQSLTLKHIVLDGNKSAATALHALIYVPTRAALYLEDGSVLRNNKNSATRGGGVNNDHGTVKLSGNALISGNEVTASNGEGGGVYSAGELWLSGNALISGNTAAKGNGVIQDGSGLRMSGGARIDQNNDVYLENHAFVHITGKLTGAAPVATLTPETYQPGTTEPLYEDIVVDGTYYNNNRFAVTAPSSGVGYTINDQGVLIVSTYWLGAEAGTNDVNRGKIEALNGSFTVPAGKIATVFMVGGGGGGMSLNNGDFSRGGGGGKVKTEYNVPAGAYNYAIGAGGSGSPWTGVAGAGGATTFGTYTAEGGEKGNDLPNEDPTALDSEERGCPLAPSLIGFMFTLSSTQTSLSTPTLKYGALGGSRKGSPIIDYPGGETGGGSPTGGNGNTAGSGTFYGAGGGGAQGAAAGGSGHQGVIFVKLNTP
jgi:hypothetical protein